jgi:hypothetical protein
MPGIGPFVFRLRSPERLISVEDFRAAAAGRVPRLVWDYVEGGADDLVTLERNRTAFSRWSLRSRVLTGHAESTSTCRCCSLPPARWVSRIRAAISPRPVRPKRPGRDWS